MKILEKNSGIVDEAHKIKKDSLSDIPFNIKYIEGVFLLISPNE